MGEIRSGPNASGRAVSLAFCVRNNASTALRLFEKSEEKSAARAATALATAALAAPLAALSSMPPRVEDDQ